MKSIRVLLADDHPVLRSGLRALLAAAGGIDVVGEASEGAEALQRVAVLQPDVLVLDLSMEGLGGAEVAKRLQAANTKTRVLILSAYDDEAYVQKLLDLGVAGYLTKDEAGVGIVDAVRQVAKGRTPVLSPSVASRLLNLSRWRTADESKTLTDRELQVLKLLSEGLGNKQIAERLGLSASTVKNHLANIYRKLEVHSRVEAVLWLQRQESNES